MPNYVFIFLPSFFSLSALVAIVVISSLCFCCCFQTCPFFHLRFYARKRRIKINPDHRNYKWLLAEWLRTRDRIQIKLLSYFHNFPPKNAVFCSVFWFSLLRPSTSCYYFVCMFLFLLLFGRFSKMRGAFIHSQMKL